MLVLFVLKNGFNLYIVFVFIDEYFGFVIIIMLDYCLLLVYLVKLLRMLMCFYSNYFNFLKFLVRIGRSFLVVYVSLMYWFFSCRYRDRLWYDDEWG